MSTVSMRFGPVRLLASVLAALLLVSNNTASADTSINSCNQVVDGGVAELTTNLACSGGEGVRFTRGGVLKLNGFEISGAGRGVRCQGVGGGVCGKLTIIGPGAIRANSSYGVDVRRIRLVDVSVTGNGFGLVGLDIGAGVHSADKLFLKASHLDDNIGYGVDLLGGGSIVLVDSTVSGNTESGIGDNSPTGIPLRLRAKRAQICANGGDGVRSVRKIKLKESSICSNGGDGVGGLWDRAVLVGSQVIDNANFGIGGSGATLPCPSTGKIRRKHRLTDSTATGNGTNPDCGTAVPCADLAEVCEPPRLTGVSVCGTSYVGASGIPGSNWGICTFD